MKTTSLHDHSCCLGCLTLIQTNKHLMLNCHEQTDITTPKSFEKAKVVIQMFFISIKIRFNQF